MYLFVCHLSPYLLFGTQHMEDIKFILHDRKTGESKYLGHSYVIVWSPTLVFHFHLGSNPAFCFQEYT